MRKRSWLRIIAHMTHEQFASLPSFQRVFALAEQAGAVNPHRFPTVVAPIADEVYTAALEEREAQLEVEVMLLDLGSTATFASAGVAFNHPNEIDLSGKTIRDDRFKKPEAKPTSEKVSDRMNCIDKIKLTVLAEINRENRDFYTVVEERNPVSGDIYPRKKYIYDPFRIEKMRQDECEALALVI